MSNIFEYSREETEEELAEDEEFRQAGVCDRAIKDNIFDRKYSHCATVRRFEDTIRCRGYIYAMNEEVCDECKKCKFQYGHPFDPYWNEQVFNVGKDIPNPFAQLPSFNKGILPNAWKRSNNA